MATFERMNKEAWKNFSRTIRANKDKNTYFFGQLFDEHQWLVIYIGLKSGVEVLPLYEHKGSYIHCCRVLYQLTENSKERNQYMQEARGWANRKA